jgi:hypothetical protein
MLLRTTRDRGDAERTWCRQVRVRVAGGYVPNTIRAEAGRPLRLIFCREESSACSEQLVLPAFIDGMGISRGRLLVTPLALGGRAHPSCPQEKRGEPGTPQLLSSTPLGEARIRSGGA